MKKHADRKIPSLLRRLNPAWKLLFFVSLSLFAVIALVLAQAWLIRNETEESLAAAVQTIAGKNRVAFSREFLTPHFSPHFTFIQRRSDIAAAAEFRGSVFAATGAGLLELTTDGEFIRRLNVADGLPESELTALAVFGDELFIGTRSNGIVVFDGERFAALRIKKRNAANITALFADSRTLLAGTLQGGLLEFDGQHLTELRFDEKPINHAIAVNRNGPLLLIGTFADGLFVRRGDLSWHRFTTADGLFSNRIVGVATALNEIFAASDLGLSRGRLEESTGAAAPAFERLFPAPLANDLAVFETGLHLATSDGELVTWPLDKLTTAPVRSSGWFTAARFGRIGERLFLFGNGGISGVVSSAGESNPSRFFRPDDKELSENSVSAVAADAAGNIWLGTFRGGIDVLSASGKPLFHLESDELRAINFLAKDGDEMLVGADGGAFRIGRDRVPIKFSKSETAGAEPTATHILRSSGDGEAISAISSTTGLRVEQRDSRRDYSTLNGLRSNSVFSTVITGGAIYAATMSGLAVIEDGRVRRVLTSSDSELRNNWITALVLSNGRIFGGTYGGGVFEIKSGSEIVSLTPPGEKVTVNPNALFADGSRLYAGTLDGLLVFDLGSGKWSKIDDPLPSATVLAVGGNDEFIFLGTTAGAVRIDKRFFRGE